MKKNQIIRNNATGETLTMLVSDEENGGACQLYEARLPHRPSSTLRRAVLPMTRGNSHPYQGSNT
jgi:hypothetical protein